MPRDRRLRDVEIVCGLTDREGAPAEALDDLAAKWVRESFERMVSYSANYLAERSQHTRTNGFHQTFWVLGVIALIAASAVFALSIWALECGGNSRSREAQSALAATE